MKGGKRGKRGKEKEGGEEEGRRENNLPLLYPQRV